jgi:chemotaxis family two-component system response regulator Rcp1
MTTIAERTEFPQVLLVEDNRGDAVLMRMAFKQADLHTRVMIAETAETALKILRREGEFENAPFPDIILLDVNLPQISGPQFLKTIKADPHLKLIPALIFSSTGTEAEIALTFSDHANGFITKPFSLDDYITVVQNIQDYWFKFVQTPETHPANVETANAA